MEGEGGAEEVGDVEEVEDVVVGKSRGEVVVGGVEEDTTK